jgi:hypothetical protein
MGEDAWRMASLEVGYLRRSSHEKLGVKVVGYSPEGRQGPGGQATGRKPCGQSPKEGQPKEAKAWGGGGEIPAGANPKAEYPGRVRSLVVHAPEI